MIDISVIIVNYNVQYFIEQAIQSINKASVHLNVEIIVVDNASIDGSVALIKKKFPKVRVIANTKNLGFSKANNQGASIARGKYFLILNPDTLLQENTLDVCYQFMEIHPKCGALGVKMIDGKGSFLPESKRSIPTPQVAFFKFSGLSNLFPKSKKFGAYYLSYLSENQTHKVEVLSGAFMFIPSKIYQLVNGFDEDYFMYGEDIDLSWKIIKQGYQNYYTPKTSIIHYKGESTKKGSLNYIKMFYEAMQVFSNKHFNHRFSFIYRHLLSLSIFLSGFFNYVIGVLKNISVFILDFILATASLAFISKLWANQIKGAPNYFSDIVYFIIIPSYVFIWLLSSALVGSYEKPYKSNPLWKGIGFGTLVIATVYAFLPESWRYSRAIILIGAISTFMVFIITRLLYNIIVNKSPSFEVNKQKNIVIVGNKKESKRALLLINEIVNDANFVGFITLKNTNEKNVLGSLENISDIISLYNVNEIVFCSKDVSTIDIIKSISLLGSKLNYKILPEESLSLVGSNSKNQAGDLYAIDVNLKLGSKRTQLYKRSFDIISSILLAATTPINIWFVKNKLGFLKNIYSVFSGKKTWVGYSKTLDDKEAFTLPKIKNGIINPLQLRQNTKGLTGNRLNLLYAKNYSITYDFSLLLLGLKQLGNVT